MAVTNVVTLTTPATKTANDAIAVPGGLFSNLGAVLSSVSQLDVLNVKNFKMLTAVDGALVG